MQIEFDRRIEESGDRIRIEFFHSAMVNTGISEESQCRTEVE